MPSNIHWPADAIACFQPLEPRLLLSAGTPEANELLDAEAVRAGVWGDQRQRRVDVVSDDGQSSRIILRGPGYVDIVAGAEGLELTTHETTLRTRLIVRSAEDVLASVTSADAMGTLVARDVTLEGRIDLSTQARRLLLGDVADGATIVLHSDEQATVDTAMPVDVFLGAIGSAQIDLGDLAVRQFKADGLAGAEVTAVGPRKIIIHGDVGDSVLDFSGEASDGWLTRVLKVRGFVDASRFTFSGSVRTTRLGAVRDTTVFAGLAEGYDLDSDGDGVLDLPLEDAQFVSDEPLVTLRTVVIRGLNGETCAVENATIAAPSIRKVRLGEVATEGAADFGVASWARPVPVRYKTDGSGEWLEHGERDGRFVNPLPNEPPMATDDDVATQEDAPVQFDPTANDNDGDGDALLVTNYTTPATGTLTLQDGGLFSFVPPADWSGQASFIYTVSDGRGGESSAVVSLVVSAVNDAPTAVNDSAVAVAGQATSIPDVRTNDSDPEGDGLSVVAFSQPSHGSVVDNGNGAFTYTPEPGFSGSDSFGYTVSDGQLVSDAVVEVTVVLENEPPVAVDDEATTSAGQAVEIADVRANDSDPNSDAFAVVEFTLPTHGNVTDRGDGAFTYFPNDGYTGQDSFTYTIADIYGAESSATVRITVTPPNLAPIATDDFAETDAGQAVVIADVRANDEDDDGDELSVAEFTQPANGTVEDNGAGVFTYTPDEGFTGLDSFTYTVTDGFGHEDTANVYVTVNSLVERVWLEDLGAPEFYPGETINQLHTYRLHVTAGEGESLFNAFAISIEGQVHQMWPAPSDTPIPTPYAKDVSYSRWRSCDTHFLLDQSDALIFIGVDETNDLSNPTETVFVPDGFPEVEAGLGTYTMEGLALLTEAIPGSSYAFFQFVVYEGQQVTVSGRAEQSGTDTTFFEFTLG